MGLHTSFEKQEKAPPQKCLHFCGGLSSNMLVEFDHINTHFYSEFEFARNHLLILL